MFKGKNYDRQDFENSNVGGNSFEFISQLLNRGKFVIRIGEYFTILESSIFQWSRFYFFRYLKLK